MNIEEYRVGLEKIEDFLKDLEPDVIAYKPAPGRWSIHEIIVHLADTEVQSHVRFRTILGDVEPQIVNHHEMNWSSAIGYESVDLDESLDVIRQMRLVNYNLLARLEEADFDKVGHHSVRGKVSLRDLVEAYTAHIDQHLDQMRRNIENREAAAES